jgi:hypothetical protein
MSQIQHIGVFESEAELVSAIDESRAKDLQVVDAYTPYPIHGIDERIGIGRSRLTLVCFAAGLTGLIVGLGFQYWTSASNWPINVGGKPFDSLPAFIPVGFELTVLFGGLATAFFLMARSRLWPGKRSRALEGVTDGRFALVIARKDATLASSELRALLLAHGAVDVWQEVGR